MGQVGHVTGGGQVHVLAGQIGQSPVGVGVVNVTGGLVVGQLSGTVTV